ncbi:glycosyltransferase family 2 protein [Avibacterium paragallinarum]|uniref:Glycosyltransferase family 2 protein n=1 Tax=Avibacterium paragallinarum TaxID=728 RepID=A0A0F5EVP2_AVIPA|nr:glycosyltransferase family 2 protein [Avibacterium paragallinarum]KAA6208103.1 glycosyltransferase family 2 protein [Avibacterium paragallinarum]KKB00684.1 glycosyltransferase [Avibacterium paragallinarum]POY45961.1 glycosyltransferase family 2 protein [Avibacterium paragallinarum]RZN58239.1 glycosyltransferase family 2 protein [Avibacterium paragallinarum]RZN61191.1 glycosyltransferase family 2 protein [Avibacterium paragallinarum]
MPTLSVAMIVKNESQYLAQCLDSVKDWVDEIVILDSGSTDNTKEIALQYGAKFYQHTDWQGFGKQRQLAQQYVTSDYVLWLDADERVTDELRENIQQAVANNLPNVVYDIPRISEVFGRLIRHSGWYPDYVVRLYSTQYAGYNDALVHEKVVYPANTKVEKLSGNLLHYPYKNLHHYLVKSANYAQAWAEQRQRQGKKASLLQGVTHAIGCFVKMYLVKAGFLDGKQGFLLAVLSAHSTFVKYADLWIRTK